ncbi:MAG: septal ring lytic transglycosylase RlpA family protein, partial [Thiothrix litoralis]
SKTMKIVQQTGLSGWSRRVGLGMTALALAVTFSLPTSVAAKEKKSSSKVTEHKKASKKVSKKPRKPKAVVKRPKTANKTGKVTKTTVAKTTKVSKSKVVSKKPRKPALKRVSYQPTKHSSSLVWKSSQKPKQAYYVMPASFSGDVAKPQQPPKYLKPAVDPVKASTASSDQIPESGKAHQVGTASYYSDNFDGKKTASGERFDQDNLTCAHGSLPFGCRIRVTNLRNNKAVDVKVNDRGGFSKRSSRVVDLSKAAAKKIGMMATGTAKVKVEVLQ